MADAPNPQAERHPPGVAVLAGTEMAERFSYYGMTALLALYMTKQLLHPGHAENVVGLAGLRHFFEFRGAMSDRAFASLIYGWYGGLVYFTPMIGGWLADRWLGTKRTVVLGLILMMAGHLAMSFDATFLIALLLLIAGSGCLKGNVAAQVGTLYPANEESRRSRGYAIFATGINIGAVVGPLATGTISEIYSWHAGFALAAGLMLVALMVYLGGQRFLPDTRASNVPRTSLPPLTSEEKRRTWVLIGLILLNIPVAVTYSMIWNIGILWIDQKVDLTSPLGQVPASWFNSLDSLGSIIAVVPLVALWAYQARRGTEPDGLAKIGMGSAIIGGFALVLMAGCLLSGDAKVSVLWPIAAYLGMGLGFMWYWPTTLAVISQTAPAKLAATLVSGAYVSLFFGSVLMGWVGSFYENMSNATFWALDGAIALAGAALIFAVRPAIRRALMSDPG
ncbi:MAG: peptide MFS transporter [Novosphingobium sp.]